MTIVKKDIFINAPYEKVHKYGTNPDNFTLYNVNLSEPENISGNGEVGTSGNYKFTMLGMKLPITIKITESNLTQEGCFSTTEISGSYTGKQITVGKPKDSGTEMMMELEYTLPGSILGKLADKIIFEKSVEKYVEQTLEKLKALCEAI